MCRIVASRMAAALNSHREAAREMSVNTMVTCVEKENGGAKDSKFEGYKS